MLLKLASLAFYVLSLVSLSLADAKIDHEVNIADNQNVTDSAFGTARTEVIIFQNGTYLKTDVKSGESGKAVLAGIDKEALQTIAGLKIYVINYGAVTFWQAVLRCIDQGLKLASVDNFINTNTLSILLPGSRAIFWVAGTDEGNEGQWIWLNLQKRILFYTNWAAGQPDNGGGAGPENCLEINRFGGFTWNDAPCSGAILNNYICEF
uniref:C-type lectin domain-containing protein n=1 Tax=Culex quinquefasciatus TaxID=7176 RepID=A0A904MUH9_CULQU